MQSTPFQLYDDEFRSRLMDCLRKDGIRLSREAFKDLESKIESSIAIFLNEKGGSSATHRFPISKLLYGTRYRSRRGYGENLR